VAAVPAVVDCDRIAVFLWSERDEALTCRAVTERYGDGSATLRELQLRPADTPTVADLVEHPEPQPRYLDPETADPLIRQLLRRLGSKALVIAPIVSRGRFYGVLTVSASERCERLAQSAELDSSLAGVVAQAATSLDNARLIETMAHQARHDSLTGLLGHGAFHEALEAELALADEDDPFTLALLDLDDFKRVNDMHGHPVGDEALRKVAEALRRCIRDHDTIFRIGGEEFAVLLPRLASKDALPVAERLRTAVGRISFAVPLRVSIGLASSPDDATDRDALLERADAALYSAKDAGKDRTTVAAVGP